MNVKYTISECELLEKGEKTELSERLIVKERKMTDKTETLGLVEGAKRKGWEFFFKKEFK